MVGTRCHHLFHCNQLVPAQQTHRLSDEHFVLWFAFLATLQILEKVGVCDVLVRHAWTKRLFPHRNPHLSGAVQNNTPMPSARQDTSNATRLYLISLVEVALVLRVVRTADVVGTQVTQQLHILVHLRQ